MGNFNYISGDYTVANDLTHLQSASALRGSPPETIITLINQPLLDDSRFLRGTKGDVA